MSLFVAISGARRFVSILISSALAYTDSEMELTRTCCFEFDRKERSGGKVSFLRHICVYFRLAGFTPLSPHPQVDKYHVFPPDGFLIPVIFRLTMEGPYHVPWQSSGTYANDPQPATDASHNYQNLEYKSQHINVGSYEDVLSAEPQAPHQESDAPGERMIKRFQRLKILLKCRWPLVWGFLCLTISIIIVAAICIAYFYGR